MISNLVKMKGVIMGREQKPGNGDINNGQDGADKEAPAQPAHMVRLLNVAEDTTPIQEQKKK